MRHVLLTALLVTAVTLSGCLAVSVDGKASRGHGPPPHAPAHGYRQHYQGADLRFDSNLGVYVVVGLSDHFYTGGRFLRFHGDGWQVSGSLQGPWNAYPAASLPPGLRGGHPSKASKPAHGRHKPHPAKGRW